MHARIHTHKTHEIFSYMYIAVPDSLAIAKYSYSWINSLLGILNSYLSYVQALIIPYIIAKLPCSRASSVQYKQAIMPYTEESLTKGLQLGWNCDLEPKEIKRVQIQRF